jgi:PAS domain S-box-containing protein
MAEVVESSPDAIYTTDLDGTITSWNAAAERIYGYASAEAIGQPNRLIIPPDRYMEEADVRQRIAAGQSVEHYDTVRRRKDGVQIDVSISVSPLRETDGTVVGVVKVARDISERKRAEAERVAADERFRTVVGAMSDAFAAVDRSWRLTYVNDQFCRMTGVRCQDVVGRVLWDVFPDATKLRLYDEAHRAMNENRPVTFEEYYRPLGLWFQTRIYPTRDGLASLTADITERKRIDQIKDESLLAARRLAAIVESSDDAIIAMDLDGTITAWNRAAERLYGYAAAEAIGRPITIILPQEQAGRAARALRDDPLSKGRELPPGIADDFTDPR